MDLIQKLARNFTHRTTKYFVTAESLPSLREARDKIGLITVRSLIVTVESTGNPTFGLLEFLTDEMACPERGFVPDEFIITGLSRL